MPEINTTRRRPSDSVQYIDFLRDHAPEFDDQLYKVIRPQTGNVDTIVSHQGSCRNGAAARNEFNNGSPNALLCDRLAALVEHVIENPDEVFSEDLLEVIEAEGLYSHRDRLEAAKGGLPIRRSAKAVSVKTAPVEITMTIPALSAASDADLLAWLKDSCHGEIGESGLYMVHLTGIPEGAKVSVNAQDPRYGHRCLHVSDANTKVGKAKRFSVRKGNYAKTFSGRAHFHPVLFVPTEAIHATEQLMKKAFDANRLTNSFSGRKTEWLSGLSPRATLIRMLQTIRATRLLEQIPGASLDSRVPDLINSLAKN